MLELRPEPLAEVRPPVSKYLLPHYLVRFTTDWPTTLAQSGKVFEITKTNQVPYVRRFILPALDFRNVDLSNGPAGGFQESLYPQNVNSLFEISLGWKLGNYVVHTYVPAALPFRTLEFSGMTPVDTDANLRYMGATKPEDSPFNDHRFFLYLVKDTDPIILRHYVLPGVVFEKCIMGIFVNKCLLQLVEKPTEEQLKKAKVIEYYSTQRW